MFVFRVFVLLSLAGAAIACSPCSSPADVAPGSADAADTADTADAPPSAETLLRRVDEAETRWNERGPSRYRYHLVERGGWSHDNRFVTVADGQWVAMEWVPDGYSIRHSCGTNSGACLRGFTVEAMFDSVRGFARGTEFDVGPVFDRALGYPSEWGHDDPAMGDDEEIYEVSEFVGENEGCPLLCQGDRPCRRQPPGGCVAHESVVAGCPPYDADFEEALAAARTCRTADDCRWFPRARVKARDCESMSQGTGVGGLALTEAGAAALTGADFEGRWADRFCPLVACEGLGRWDGAGLDPSFITCVDGACATSAGVRQPLRWVACFGGRIFDRLPDAGDAPDPRCAGVGDCRYAVPPTESDPGCLCVAGYCFGARPLAE